VWVLLADDAVDPYAEALLAVVGGATSRIG